MQEKTFEIGLVMAGAISAGAYTSGVVDYLLQALKEWESVKNKTPHEAPPHKVQLKVVAGSSAGGMTGAILASMVNGPFEAITSLPRREPNRKEIANNELYSAWVDRIDISELLGEDDLRAKGSKVTSLLDSTVLEKIANLSIQFKADGKRSSFIAEQLHLYLTLTNLQGIPYYTTFQGESGEGHGIVNHKDYFQFLLSSINPDDPAAQWLNAQDASFANWDLLKNVAIATGAFPGGLAARVINRTFSQYDYRKWRIPLNPDKNDPSAPNDCYKYEHIEPAWPPHDNDQFSFLAVDGGVMDNEPTELARRALAGDDKRNPRNPERACRSIIMVDPFPTPKSVKSFETDVKNKSIAHVLMKLVGSMKSQSRFNPDELILAASKDVYSRFLIAPTRHEGKQWADYPIASGSLNGFGGFLSKGFRMHDFQLGRRNCQQFLKKYFAIPVEKAKRNAVFANYEEDDFKRFSFNKNGEGYVPIIPLLGECKKEEKPIQWNSIKMSEPELQRLQSQIKDRTKIVLNRLIEQYVKSAITRFIVKLIACVKRNDMVKKMMKIIKDDLEEFMLR